MAFAQAAQGQPASAQASVVEDGKPCVLRAGGVKAALIAHPGAEEKLIDTDQAKKKMFHGYVGLSEAVYGDCSSARADSRDCPPRASCVQGER